MRVIGIDPGVSGAIAVLDSSDLSRVDVYPFPTVKVISGSKKRTRLDVDECDALLKAVAYTSSPGLIVFEDVNGFSGNQKMTGASGFVFGRAAGLIEGMVIALSLPRAYASPKEWKAAHKLTGKMTYSERKAASRQAASRLFPQSSDKFARDKDDGVAEAALLAHYGLTRILGYRDAY